MSSTPDVASRLLRRERWIVAGTIALLTALSWWFLLRGPDMPPSMSMGVRQPPVPALILMWSLMMVAMMLPSATPAVLLYARVRERQGASGRVVQPLIFATGYLAAWLLFSIVAATAQNLLAGPATTIENRLFASALLIAVGAYQLSPVKRACLRQCRSPAQFLSRHWRPGIGGAVRLGLMHGAYCLGCCWLLMALLFVGGVMNFAWIAALALLVGIEKLAPRGDLIGRAAGVALIAWGLLRLFT